MIYHRINPIDWAQAQPCTLAGHDDCHYWGLTLGQCFDYHGRLRVYHRDRAEALWEKYERGNTVVFRVLYLASGFAAGNAVFQIIWAATR